MAPKPSAAAERLVSAYAEAALRIERLLKTATGRNRAVLLKQVDQILAQIDSLTAEYLQRELPIQYKDGSQEAINQLRKIQGLSTIIDSFGAIHTEAIRQIAQDATLRFAAAITAVRQDITSRLRKAEKQTVIAKILEKQIEGAGNTTAAVKQVFEEQGIVAFQGKTKTIGLDHYASMLTITTLAEAHNTGAAIRYAENGIGFVQVVEHGEAVDVTCRFFNGKVVALAERRLQPPYHPNCFGGIKPFLGEPVDPIISVDDPRIPAEARKLILRK